MPAVVVTARVACRGVAGEDGGRRGGGWGGGGVRRARGRKGTKSIICRLPTRREGYRVRVFFLDRPIDSARGNERDAPYERACAWRASPKRARWRPSRRAPASLTSSTPCGGREQVTTDTLYLGLCLRQHRRREPGWMWATGDDTRHALMNFDEEILPLALASPRVSTSIIQCRSRGGGASRRARCSRSRTITSTSTTTR